MITAANRGQIEPISEIALNLLKGNIIPKSSFERLKPYKVKLLYLMRKKKKQASNRRKKCLIKKEAFTRLIAPLTFDLL